MAEPVVAAAPRRKRRRWMRLLLGIVVFLLLIRIVFGLLLPKVVDRLVAGLGLTVTWEDIDFTLLGGSFELTHVVAARRDGGGELAHVDTLLVDVALLPLFHGRLHVHRVELDGVRGSVVREADGSITLDGWWLPKGDAAQADAAAPAVAPPVAPASAPAAAPAPFDFTLPFAIDLLRLQNVRVAFHDRWLDAHRRAGAATPFVVPVSLDLSVDDVGHAQRPLQVTAAVRMPGAVDAVMLEGSIDAHGAKAEWTLRLLLNGVSGHAARLYLPEAGVAPTTRKCDAAVRLRGKLEPTDAGALTLRGDPCEVEVDFDVDGERAFEAKVAATIAAWTGGSIDLAKVATRFDLHARRKDDGTLAACGIEWRPAEPVANQAVAIALRGEGAFGPLAFGKGTAAPPIAVDFVLSEQERKFFALALKGAIEPFAASPHGKLALDLGLPAGSAGLAELLGKAADGLPEFRDVQLTLALDGSATPHDDGSLAAGLTIGPLRLLDRAGGTELLALERLALRDVTVGPGAIDLVLGELELRGVKARLPTDGEPFELPFEELDVRATATANRAAEGTRAKFGVTVTLPGTVGELKLDGEVASNARQLDAVAKIAGHGLQGGVISRLLPPEITWTAKDGRIAVERIAAHVATDEAGHRSVEFEVGDVAWRDGEGEPSLALKTLRAKVPHFEAPNGPVVVEEIVTEGLTLDVARVDATTFDFLGLRLSTASAPAPERAAAAVAAPPTPSPPSSSSPATEAAAPPAARSLLRLPPRIELGRLDVGVERLKFRDGLRPDDPPFDASFAVRTSSSAVLWSEEAAEIEPLRLAVGLHAEPLLRELALAVTATPFAVQPELALTLDVKGFSGPRLLQLLPQLAESVDLADCTDATLHAQLDVAADLKRRGAVEIDLAAGFGGEVTLRDFVLRPTPEGEPIVALELLGVDIARMRPTTGDLHLRALEIRKPSLHVRRTADALHVGALTIKLPPPAPPAEAPAAPSAEAPPAAPPAEPTVAAPVLAAERPELRIDTFLFTGIDFTLNDESVTPPLVLPLVDLDVEVRRFTTRLLTEPRTVDFRVAVAAGDVELPHRDEQTLVGGVLSNTAGRVGIGVSEVKLEPRPAWNEVAVQGQLALFPKPTGSVRIDVRALELPAFRGALAGGGVVIGDGVVDSSVNAKLREVEGLEIDSVTTIGALELSEPPGGPISTFLKLPMPLDSVLFLLHDESGQITLPIDVEVPAEGLSTAKVARVASEALLRLIADAVKGAPMRVVSGALDATQLQSIPGISSVPGLGALLGAKEELPPFDGTPAEIAFEAGGGALRADCAAQLEPLLERLRDDRSLSLIVDGELGGDDLAALERWARPADEGLLALATRLRTRSAFLARERDVAAPRVRAALAAGDATALAASQETLRAIERSLAETARSLDETLELVGGAKRAVALRARAAAKELAQRRLDVVRELLLGSDVDEIALRLEVKRPRATATAASPAGLVRLSPVRRHAP